MTRGAERTEAMFRLVGSLAIFVLVAAACGAPSAPAPTGPASKVGGTLNRVATTDPDTLDLHKTSNTASSAIFGWIYEPLVYEDLDGSYKGLLAESWTVTPDNKSVTFKLRQGIRFTDGTTVNADAAKFTYERLQRVGAKSPLFEFFKNVAAMEASDEFTFKMTLKEPYAPIFHDLQVSYAGILSPKAVQAANDDIGRTPVGTGPYKLKAWQTGQLVALERNADYDHAAAYNANRGAPYIQEIRYRIIAETATQLAALEAGEIDVLGLPAKDIPRYSADPRFKLYDSFEVGLVYLGFTAVRPPFDNPKVRQAFAHAVNKDEIVQVVYGGTLAKAQCCPIAESIWGYDPKLREFERKYDPATAKRLLDELGYRPGPDGLRTTPEGKPFKPALYTTTSEERGKAATLIQAQLKAVGVDLQVKQLESGALLAATPKGEHDLYLNGYSWNEPDMFSLFLSCDRVKSSNRVLYCSQDLERLIKAGRTELDPQKRLQIYFDAQKHVLVEAPWQPLFMPVGKTAVSAKIAGLKQGRSGGLIWQDAYFAQ